MNKELIKNADGCYGLAEQRAAEYFKSLYEQVIEKTYVTTLIKDIQGWKEKHIYNNLLLSFFVVEIKNHTLRIIVIILNG